MMYNHHLLAGHTLCQSDYSGRGRCV